MYGKKVGIVLGISFAILFSIGLYFDSPRLVANGKPSIQPEEDWGTYKVINVMAADINSGMFILSHKENGFRIKFHFQYNDSTFCLRIGDEVRVKKYNDEFILEGVPQCLSTGRPTIR